MTRMNLGGNMTEWVLHPAMVTAFDIQKESNSLAGFLLKSNRDEYFTGWSG